MAKFPYGIVPSKIERTLRSGHSGDDVKALQDALNKMGYDCGEVDGIFGWKTASALKKFQKNAKSKGWNPQIGYPDGVFGP
jgi:peptidoglycan hydrolase-like protein with peptidoglycan-binding domain